jgi:phosphoserine phosphatase RsbU/P
VTAAASSEHSDRSRTAFLDALTHDDPVELYDSAPCGFLTTTPDGLIVKTNATFRRWVQREAADLVGELTFSDLLTVGGKVYYGTHVGPMLQMSGQVQEIALDLVCPEGDRLPVLVNATLARGEDGLPRAIRIAVFDATERRSYERELLDAKHRAEASEREARALARTLQQTLIPPSPPTIPGLDVATAYQPAGHGTEVGGDFYDVFRVGDDWVITLGDVCGKGPEAAVVTSLVRHTVRALCVGEKRPSAVLLALDEVLREHPTDRFCTAVLARLTREGGSWLVTLGVGGHPQPLLLRHGRPPEPCGTTGPLLGVVDHATYADTTLRLDPGDALLLYTDGIIEGRRGSELYGDDRLIATAERLGPDPALLVDVLVRELLEFQDGTLRDDVALVAFGPPA